MRDQDEVSRFRRSPHLMQLLPWLWAAGTARTPLHSGDSEAQRRQINQLEPQMPDLHPVSAAGLSPEKCPHILTAPQADMAQPLSGLPVSDFAPTH